MAAGVDTAKLECWLGDSFRVIRAMPNTPVEVNTASYAA
jgi:pyrroline-5-carboxylate reductase